MINLGLKLNLKIINYESSQDFSIKPVPDDLKDICESKRKELIGKLIFKTLN